MGRIQAEIEHGGPGNRSLRFSMWVVAIAYEGGKALHALVIQRRTVKRPAAPYMCTAISSAVEMCFSLTSEGPEAFGSFMFVRILGGS
jgi:hypothetical protein